MLTSPTTRTTCRSCFTSSETMKRHKTASTVRVGKLPRVDKAKAGLAAFFAKRDVEPHPWRNRAAKRKLSERG